MSQYKIGTVSTTNGSAVVTGSGTSWLSNIDVGDLFALQKPNDPYNVAYEVGSVNSNTQITLTAPFNATVAGSAYVLHRDFHPNGNPKFANGDVETAAILNRWTNQVLPVDGFGTAATFDAQTSPTDTTANALMKVGAFGIGDSPDNSQIPAWPNSPDLNNISGVPTGDYGGFVTGTVTTGNGWPENLSNINYQLSWQWSSPARAIMTLRVPRKNSVAAEDIWIRTYTGTFSTWRKVYHTGNLLGTVSQSGGVPTGSVIERGSNANGAYVKFADGTMICQILAKSIGGPDSALGTIFQGSSTTWMFPTSFVGNFPVAFGNDSESTSIWLLADAELSTCLLREVSGVPITGVRSCKVTAIGRWY